MFTLIITIIAIALGSYLLMTSANYGGDSLTQGSAKAEASALANEASQISAAYDLHRVENAGAAPADVAELVSDGYLKRAPAGWTIEATGFENSSTGNVCQYVANTDNGLNCHDTGDDSLVDVATAEAALETVFTVRYAL